MRYVFSKNYSSFRFMTKKKRFLDSTDECRSPCAPNHRSTADVHVSYVEGHPRVSDVRCDTPKCCVSHVQALEIVKRPVEPTLGQRQVTRVGQRRVHGLLRRGAQQRVRQKTVGRVVEPAQAQCIAGSAHCGNGDNTFLRGSSVFDVCAQQFGRDVDRGRGDPSPQHVPFFFYCLNKNKKKK